MSARCTVFFDRLFSSAAALLLYAVFAFRKWQEERRDSMAKPALRKEDGAAQSQTASAEQSGNAKSGKAMPSTAFEQSCFDDGFQVCKTRCLTFCALTDNVRDSAAGHEGRDGGVAWRAGRATG